MFLEECNNVGKEKKMPKYIIEDIELCYKNNFLKNR